MAVRRRYLPPIERQIYFYQMLDIPDLWRLPKFTPALLAKDLKALAGDARYHPGTDEYDLVLISDGGDAFRFGKARKTEMARVEVNGSVKPLILSVGEKLFDCIHLVFFPGGIVGTEFNLVGPKMPDLTAYLSSKLKSCTPVAFDRLVHRDMMERLSRLHEVRLIEMRVDVSRSEVLAPFGEGLIETTRYWKEQFGVGSVALTLGAGSTAHGHLLDNALSAIRQVFERADVRDVADKFCIEAVPDGQNVAFSINLLDDKLMTKVKVPRSIYQNPDRYKEFIYTEIRDAYRTLKPDIMQAARIIP